MEIISKLKLIIEIVSAGQVWSRRKDFAVALADLVRIIADSFLANDNSPEPGDVLQSAQPLTDAEAVERMTAMIAELETQQDQVEDGMLPLTIPPVMWQAILTWGLGKLAELLRKRFGVT